MKQITANPAVKEKFISIMEKALSLCATRLSDDVMDCLEEMRAGEDSALQKAIYDSYMENLKLARNMKHPCCQDTGMIQFYIKAGSSFPYLDITSKVLTEAVKRATSNVPLRPNAVNFFEDSIACDNIGELSPWISWEIIPDSSEMEITLYFSGAGCSLPGTAKVFKPSDGLEAIVPFIFDAVCGAGINACPPLLVGIGLGHNIDTAAYCSKKALLRPLGTKHHHPKGAELERLIKAGLNNLGIGAQGLRGNRAVMGVHIETSARHTATIACAVNTSCYMLRRLVIRIKDDLSFELITHKRKPL